MIKTIAGVHPYADKFPMLPDSELTELAESIRANGLRNPIVLTRDWLVLDGRNRLAACELADVTPETVVYDGDDLAEYVIDANTSRRHMSTGARAMATALVLADDGRRDGGRWKRGSVAIGESPNSATWRAALADAGRVLDHAPDLAGQVVDGTLALDAAHRQAEERRDAERNELAEQERRDAEESDARRFINETAPDLAAQVTDVGPLQTFVEARDIWNRRNREEASRLAAEKAIEQRRHREDREARSQLYSGICRGLQIVGGYGQYDDIPKLMADYEPTELDPPQYERELNLDNLASAARFIAELTKWAEARQ